ncbi:MAG: tight adherence protein [Alphaproteobacteria bacterium]|jgi:tight adherence protein C|nr:tight adherence protein [Alphaproteobacteria bacterium]
MIIKTLVSNTDLIVACTAAISVFFASVAVFWPYLVPDIIGSRMRRMAGERETIRIRERRRLNVGKLSTLTTEPKQIFKEIFDRLNLAKEAENGDMVHRLRMAGYRGRGPVVTFVAMRLIMPAVLFSIVTLYVFVVLQLQYPLFAKLSIVCTAALLGYYIPALFVSNRIAKRQKSIRRAWPDALDLLLICVESGMGIESAFRKVSEEIGSQSLELAEELALTTAELSYLSDRRTAYQNLALRTGLDGVKGVVLALVQAEKYGTPVGNALRVFAQEQRDARISDAEKKAASLPPKLTVPMILFFLPVLFAIIITPAAIQIMSNPQ